MADMMRALAITSSGLRIVRSAWSTTKAPDLPDLIQFEFVGKRGGRLAEVSLTPEAARYYHDQLSDLLGVPRVDWPAPAPSEED